MSLSSSRSRFVEKIEWSRTGSSTSSRQTIGTANHAPAAPLTAAPSEPSGRHGAASRTTPSPRERGAMPEYSSASRPTARPAPRSRPTRSPEGGPPEPAAAGPRTRTARPIACPCSASHSPDDHRRRVNHAQNRRATDFINSLLGFQCPAALDLLMAGVCSAIARLLRAARHHCRFPHN